MSHIFCGKFNYLTVWNVVDFKSLVTLNVELATFFSSDGTDQTLMQIMHITRADSDDMILTANIECFIIRWHYGKGYMHNF